MENPEQHDEIILIQSIIHRLDLLKKLDKTIKSNDLRQNLRVKAQKKLLDKEIAQMKEEVFALKQTISSLHKVIFVLGAKLKHKVAKKELEEVENKFQAKNFEFLLTKKELPELFDNYAKP